MRLDFGFFNQDISFSLPCKLFNLLLSHLLFHDNVLSVLHITGIADTYTSLAVCCEDSDEKMFHFENAEDIIGTAGGSTEDAAIGRLYMNLGIFHELTGTTSSALHYYQKYLHSSQQLFGPCHPESKRATEAISKLGA